MILHLLIFSLIILPLASKAMNCEMAYQKKIEDAQDFVANGSAMVVAGTVLKRMQPAASLTGGAVAVAGTGVSATSYNYYYQYGRAHILIKEARIGSYDYLKSLVIKLMEEGVLREDVEFEDVASYIRHLEANRTLCPRDRHEALAGLSIKNDQTIPIESVMSLDTLISLVTNHFGKDD